MGFIPRKQRWFNISKSINVIHHINKKNYQNHFLSTDAEKAFDKVQHPLMIKTLEKMVAMGRFLNKIKAIYDQFSASIILNGEKTKSFPLKSKN